MQGYARHKGFHSLNKVVNATNEMTLWEKGLAGMEVLTPGYDCIGVDKHRALSPGVVSFQLTSPTRLEAGSEDDVDPMPIGKHL